MHPKTREKLILTVVGWLVAGLIFFPIFWMILTSFKTEIEAVATPPQLFFSPTLENYTVVRERADYVHFALNSIIISVGATLLATLIAVPGRLRDGVLPGQADQGPAALDAVDQDDAGGRRADPDLPSVPRLRRARHALGPDRRLHADEPADRGLDALHLLQGGAEGHPRGRPHGRRQAQAGGLDAADAPVPAGDRVDRAAVDHPVLERGLLEPQPDQLATRRRSPPSSPRSRPPKGCSGPSSRPPRRSRSRRSSSSAG